MTTVSIVVNVTVRPLRTPVQLGQDEFPVAQSLCGNQAAVQRAYQHVDQGVSGIIEGHVTPEYSSDVDVYVFAHGFHGNRVRRRLDYRDDGITDDVALAGCEEMDDGAGGGPKRDGFGGGRRGVHEPEAFARGGGGRFQDAHVTGLLADLL